MRNEWADVKIEAVFDFIGGGTPSKQEKKYWNGEIHWASIKDVKGDYLTNTKDFITSEGLQNSAANLAKPGQIILATRITPGRPIITTIETAINQDLKIVIPKIDIDNHFAFYSFLALEKDILRVSSGTTVLGVNLTQLKNIDFPLPPLPEQRAIVTKLEALFRELDEGIASLQRAQDQLKIYRQAVLEKAFEGELTRAWREQQTDLPTAAELLAQIQVERERYYQEQLVEWEEAVRVWEAEGKVGKKPSKPKSRKIDDLESKEVESATDNSWSKIPLIHLCDLIGGVTKGRKLDGAMTIFVPYLRVANVQDGYLDLSVIKEVEVLPSDQAKYELRYGDILYTEGGDKDKLGRGTIWKNEVPGCIHQNHIFRARPFSEKIDSKYISYYSQSKVAKSYFFENAKQTTNLASINLTVLSNLPVQFCSLPEQHQIVQEIESRLSVCDQVEKDIVANLKRAERLRQSILQKAFAGELLTEAELAACRAEPDWEPAEVLLERIKKHKVK